MRPKLALGDDAADADGELLLVLVLEELAVLPPPELVAALPPPPPPLPRSTAEPLLAPLGLLRAPLPASPPALGLCAMAGAAASVNPASTTPSLKLRTFMTALHGDLAVRRLIVQQICHRKRANFTGGKFQKGLPVSLLESTPRPRTGSRGSFS